MTRQEKIHQLSGHALVGIFVFGGALVTSALLAWSLGFAKQETAFTTILNTTKVGLLLVSVTAILYATLIVGVVTYHQYVLREAEDSRKRHPVSRSESSRVGS